MKKLKYTALGYTDNYNFKTGQIERKETLVTVTRPYSEAGEEIAKREAYNGKYAIDDDGVEEVVQFTTDERLEKLEKAIEDIPAQIKNALKAFLNNT